MGKVENSDQSVKSKMLMVGRQKKLEPKGLSFFSSLSLDFIFRKYYVNYKDYSRNDK